MSNATLMQHSMNSTVLVETAASILGLRRCVID